MACLRRQKQQIVARSQRQTVSSPIAGEVLTLYQKVGAYVTVGTPVALVGDFRTLRFAVPIDKRENKRISLGQEALFPLTATRLCKNLTARSIKEEIWEGIKFLPPEL